MVTASHNPPQDNGYKVYLGDGSQIVPPADARDRRADRRPSAPLADVPRGDGWATLGDDGARRLPRPGRRRCVARTAPRDLRIVYTPLHGVGRDVVLRRRSRRAGFADAVRRRRSRPSRTRTSRRSRSPTPRSRARWTSRSRWPRTSDADLVLANDPDADRCAVAVPDPATAAGGCCAATRSARCSPTHLRRAAGVASTRTCSPARSSRPRCSSRIAAAHGLPLRRDADRLQVDRAGAAGLAYGYEEALGYCVDPDGGPRQGRRLRGAARRRARRRRSRPRAATLLDLLDDLAREHGLHATDQLSVRVDDLVADRRRDGAAARRRRRRRSAAARSTAVEDLAAGRRRPAADRRPALPPRRAAARVVVRPSGTEPKLKCYLEVVVPVLAGEVDLSGVRRTAADRRWPPYPRRRDPGRGRSTTTWSGGRRARSRRIGVADQVVVDAVARGTAATAQDALAGEAGLLQGPLLGEVRRRRCWPRPGARRVVANRCSASSRCARGADPSPASVRRRARCRC